MSDVTRILNAIEAGDARAADELLPLVYEQLRACTHGLPRGSIASSSPLKRRTLALQNAVVPDEPIDPVLPEPDDYFLARDGAVVRDAPFRPHRRD